MQTSKCLTAKQYNYRFRWSIFIACTVFTWFALNGSVNRFIHYAKGDTTSMWVCTQSGLKKISMPADSDNSQGQAVDIKHCGDSPIFKQIAIPNPPAELKFEQPLTIATWRWIQPLQAKPDLLKDKRWPPKQAPPSTSV